MECGKEKRKTMTMFQDVNAEELARLFHHYRAALVQGPESHTGEASTSWERTPQTERKVMVAAARLALLELARTPTRTAQPDPERKYYAKPGEADWGC